MHYAVYWNAFDRYGYVFVWCLERMVDTVIGIKLFYQGHKCAEIVVDNFIYSNVFSDGKWVGIVNNVIVCTFDDSQYDIIETDYGFEVNKVV
jgi:hypothetical protein|nr:MAG TPA: hypothetical protein [Bacteriophage sp.]